ncbi:MAG: hypothetical protein AB8H80_23425 [Planctomycetota bacterium]
MTNRCSSSFGAVLTAAALAASSGASLLAQSQQWTDLGSGVPGAMGVPVLEASTARYGNNLRLHVEGVAAQLPVLFVVGTTRIDVPVFAGVLVPDPALVLTVAQGGSDRNANVLLPDVCLAGVELYAQVVAFDPVAVQDWSFSNAIQAVVRDNVPSDFNGDGYSDLAVGSPDEDVQGEAAAGAVSVVYGSANGLQTAGNQLIRQGSDINGLISGVFEAGDRFGTSLAWGDFDSDGFDDLVIGIPREGLSGRNQCGAVQVIYGSASGLQGGNLGRNDQFLSQGLAGVTGQLEDFDWFGHAVAAGDYDGDGYDDLAIGAPLENEALANDGVVHVLFGSATGLSVSGDDELIVDPVAPEIGDRFGWTLLASNVYGSEVENLIVGAPYEDLGGATDAGAVSVLRIFHGFAPSYRWLHRDTSILGQPIAGIAATNDLFGMSLAAADMQRDGADDLMIGVPFDDPGSISAGGTVHFFRGELSQGLSGYNSIWDQDSPGVAGVAQLGERFGYSLATLDWDDDGFPDLAVGVPNDRSTTSTSRIGRVNILRGGPSGDLTGAQGSLIDFTTIGLGPTPFDTEFGWSLAAGRYRAGCRSRLAVGIPAGIVNGVTCGSVAVAGGGVPAVLWSQAPLLGAIENGDRFGGSMLGSPDIDP